MMRVIACNCMWAFLPSADLVKQCTGNMNRRNSNHTLSITTALGYVSIIYFKLYLVQIGFFLYFSSCKNGRAFQKCCQNCHIFFSLGATTVVVFLWYDSFASSLRHCLIPFIKVGATLFFLCFFMFSWMTDESKNLTSACRFYGGSIRSIQKAWI